MIQKKKVSFQADTGVQHSEQAHEKGKGEYSWTKLATKKWTTAAKPGLSKSSAEQLVDVEKRDALAKSLDLKTLFEYLNSSEESALEVSLAAFHHRIEEDYQSKLASDNTISSRQASQTGNTSGSSPSTDLLPSGSLLQQYLENSPETNELWSILILCIKRDKTKSVMAVMLLSCFGSILKFTTWPHLKYIRNNIARTFTKSHIHMCSSNLASDQPMLINATLSVLTEIVNVSQFHARDLFTAFNWSQKSFFQLVSRKNASYEGRQSGKEKPDPQPRHHQQHQQQQKTHSIQQQQQPSKETSSSASTAKEEYQRLYLLDVRTHYIQFGLSFLEHDDSSLSQDVLGVNGFLNGIFKDMQYDTTALILQTFETLHEHVLLNKSISKTCKVHFFTSWILSQISIVYKRFTMHRNPTEKLGALASLTRRRLQAFLESLLTSPTEGIIYLDIARPFPPSAQLLPANEELSLGTASNASGSSTTSSSQHPQFHSRNRNVLKFFNALQPQESEWQEKLLLKVLDKDILLARQYFADLKLSIEPRPTNSWLKSISLLMKLLDVRPLDYFSLVNAATTEIATFSFERVAAWYIPPSCLQRAYLSAGLRHSNISVRFVTVNLIHRVLTVLDDVSTAFHTELSSSPSRETTLLHQLHEGISNVFKRKVPDLDSILTLFNTGMVLDASKPHPKPTNDTKDPQEFALDVDNDMLNAQIMILMSAYMRRFPESFVELNFDTGKLFSVPHPWTQSLRVQDGLLTMLESAVQKLRWNATLPGAAQAKSTQLGYLLQYAINTKDSSVQSRVAYLCRQMLSSSGLLDRSPTEIEAWLDMLIHSSPHSSCAAYLESALVYLSQAPHYWAEEMSRQIQATESIELQSAWRLAPFPSSAIVLPFSLLTLSIIKDHAHILQQSLGGPTTIDAKMQDSNTWIQLTQISEFLLSTVLQLLLASEIPLPLVHVISSFAATTAGPLPSHDTGRSKTVPLSDNVLKTPVFTSLFHNLSGFLHKIFAVPLPSNSNGEHKRVGVDLRLPPANEWSTARLHLQISIFEYGHLAEQMGLAASTLGHTMRLEVLDTIDWSKLGAVHFFCHLLSSPHRSVLVYDERIKSISLRLMSDPSSMIPSVQTLLFFVGTFLEDAAHAGDCLHFALHLLSSLFFQTLRTMQEARISVHAAHSGQASSSSTTPTIRSATDYTSSTKTSVTVASKESTSSIVSSKILRLILGNPSLNAHFLRDLSSPASIALNNIIAQVLEAIVTQSAHYLADDVKELVAIPLTKLSLVFSELIQGKHFPSIAQCIPLIRTFNCFTSPSIYEDMIQSILSISPKVLLSDEGRPLLELLVSMLLHVSSNHNAVFKLSVPCFKFATPPANVAHIVYPSLLSEMKRSSVFEAPICHLSTFSSLISLQNYCAKKQHKLPFEIEAIAADLDGAILRILLSSFNASIMLSGSSSTTSASSVDEINMPLGESSFIPKLPAPSILPDFAILMSDEMLDALLDSLRKHIESNSGISTEQLSMLHRAAIVSLLPKCLSRSSAYSKLLSKFSKGLDAPICDISLKSSAIIKDLQNGSLKFMHALQAAFSAHSRRWFLLVLLHTHLVHGIQVEEKMLTNCFKPFVRAVLGAVLHRSHLRADGGAPTSISALLDYLIDFGVPIFTHLLKNNRKSVMKDTEYEEICATFAELANSKNQSLDAAQLSLMMHLYSSSGSLATVLPLFVSQGAFTIQSIVKLQETPSSPGSSAELGSQFDLLSLILEHLRSLIPVASGMGDSELLKAFRRLLRHGYEHAEVLEWVLAVARTRCQSSSSSSSSAAATSLLSNLHDLIVSHSSFVKLLLSKEQPSSNKSSILSASSSSASSSSSSASARVPLLQLLCLVYAAEPDSSNKFSPKMLALYLSAYHATLSPSDQLMLHIVMLFERHGVNFSQAGFLWGSVAQDYKSTSSRPTSSLSLNTAANTTPSSSSSARMDVDESNNTSSKREDLEENGGDDSRLPHVELSTFHSLLLGGQLTHHRQMLTTVRSFSPYLPLATGPQYLDSDVLFPRSGAQTLRTSPQSVYDPRFLLFVYQFGLNFFGEFDAKKFIEIGGLSLVLQALASFDADVRQLGYSVLSAFSTVVDKMESPIREAPQIRLLISVLRAAISVENLRLSSVTSSFLGEASLVLVRHDHPLFLELHNYMLSRPALSLTSTPILKRFLISSRNASRTEREWALRMVESGIRSPSDLPLLGLRAAGTKAVNSHVLATLVSHLSSNLSSSFSAISERHRIWSILCKLITNDAPSFKNMLLGPGGIVPFLAIWTSNHALNTDSFAIVPSASIPSPYVYAEVASVLRTIISLPELHATITKSRPLWLQIQPLIGNILQYLQLSYAKLGSLRSSPPSIATVTPSYASKEVEGEEANEEHESNNHDDSSTDHALSHNVYWKLLSPCITLLYHFSANSALPSGAPISMVNLAQRLLSHLAGTFRPVCPLHLSSLLPPPPPPPPHASSSSDSSTARTSSMEVELNDGEDVHDALQVRCTACSLDQIQVAKHYTMLAQAIVLDKPDDFTEDSMREWFELAQFALRVVLYSPSTSTERFHSLRTLIGQMVIMATTSSRATMVNYLAASIVDRETNAPVRALLDAVLFAYRQHSPDSIFSKTDYRNDSIILLLNTLCTLILAHSKRRNFFGVHLHEDWSRILTGDQFLSFMRLAKTLSTNTLHEASLKQMCQDMTEEEANAHSKLSHLFRVMLASDLTQQPISSSPI